jgi:hypothetical protein
VPESFSRIIDTALLTFVADFNNQACSGVADRQAAQLRRPSNASLNQFGLSDILPVEQHHMQSITRRSALQLLLPFGSIPLGVFPYPHTVKISASC